MGGTNLLGLFFGANSRDDRVAMQSESCSGRLMGGYSPVLEQDIEDVGGDEAGATSKKNPSHIQVSNVR